MTSKISFQLFNLVLYLVSVNSCIAQNWELEYDKKGLQVYTTGEGIKTYRIETEVNAPVRACVALMQDIKKHPKFLSSIKRAQLDKQVSETEFYLYYKIDLPWPYQDRDVYTNAKFIKLPDGGVRCDLKSQPHLYPKTNLVRMEDADGYWLFTPISDVKTKLTYEFRSDPKGVPTYLVNKNITKGPLKSVKKFKKWCKKRRYKKKDIAWL